LQAVTVAMASGQVDVDCGIWWTVLVRSDSRSLHCASLRSR